MVKKLQFNPLKKLIKIKNGEESCIIMNQYFNNYHKLRLPNIIINNPKASNNLIIISTLVYSESVTVYI